MSDQAKVYHFGLFGFVWCALILFLGFYQAQLHTLNVWKGLRVF